MADPTLLRDISIKTGVVKRLVKELCYYEKEEEKSVIKLQAMQGSSDADEHVVKKQIELIQVIFWEKKCLSFFKETKQMIPECARRLMNS
ncbi:unnamed protein product, partial [Brugia pahangi]|uniref:Tubulin-specific chaperone A n=1 Tax=Brugia pahangi TaxID=6280 RepID=A0A0N4TH21_BRUPA